MATVINRSRRRNDAGRGIGEFLGSLLTAYVASQEKQEKEEQARQQANRVGALVDAALTGKGPVDFQGREIKGATGPDSRAALFGNLLRTGVDIKQGSSIFEMVEDVYGSRAQEARAQSEEARAGRKETRDIETHRLNVEDTKTQRRRNAEADRRAEAAEHRAAAAEKREQAAFETAQKKAEREKDEEAARAKLADQIADQIRRQDLAGASATLAQMQEVGTAANLLNTMQNAAKPKVTKHTIARQYGPNGDMIQKRDIELPEGMELEEYLVERGLAGEGWVPGSLTAPPKKGESSERDSIMAAKAFLARMNYRETPENLNRAIEIGRTFQRDTRTIGQIFGKYDDAGTWAASSAPMAYAFGEAVSSFEEARMAQQTLRDAQQTAMRAGADAAIAFVANQIGGANATVQEIVANMYQQNMDEGQIATLIGLSGLNAKSKFQFTDENGRVVMLPLRRFIESVIAGKVQ